MLIQSLFDQPVLVGLWVVAVILALTVHEFSHALTARILGDHTAEEDGRLTLNPLVHIDWLGFVLLLIAGFGWAKPTPVNPYNLKYQRFGSALVAFAGPISNITMALIIAIALRVYTHFVGLELGNLMVVFFLLFIQINALLAVFNLIPIPPLDGSKVLYAFVGPKYPEVVEFLERYGLWLLLAVVFLGGGVIQTVAEFFYNIAISVAFEARI
jgi:Zn-dependent protease